MDFEYVENILIDELIYASFLVSGSKDYVSTIQSLDNDIDSRVLEEVYLNLLIQNQYCIRVLLGHGFLYDKNLGKDLAFYKLPIAEQIKRFLSDKEFAVSLIEKYFKVFKHKKRYALVLDALNIQERRIWVKLSTWTDEVLSFNDKIKMIFKNLYNMLLLEGYTLEEILNIMFIYWDRNGINPMLIEKYMSYQVFVSSKAYQLKMMIVVVYQCLLVSKEDDSELDYLRSLVTLPSVTEEKRRIFNHFLMLIIEEKDREVTDEVLKEVPMQYRGFTL